MLVGGLFVIIDNNRAFRCETFIPRRSSDELFLEKKYAVFIYCLAIWPPPTTIISFFTDFFKYSIIGVSFLRYSMLKLPVALDSK